MFTIQSRLHQKLFVLAAILGVLITNNPGSLEAKEFMPVGVLISKPKGRLRLPHTACFVPMKVDDVFLIVTAIPGVTLRECSIGVCTDSKQIRAPLLSLIEGGDELKDPERDATEFTELNISFFPLVSEAPNDAEQKQVWNAIRERAVDLVSASKDVSIPNATQVYCLRGIGKCNVQIKEIEIGSAEEIDNIWRNLINEPLYRFELKQAIDHSDNGSPCFREIPKDKTDVSRNFLGVCFPSTKVDISDVKEDGSRYYVMLHPLTILRFLQQQNDPRKP
jgi:hypothetical protein